MKKLVLAVSAVMTVLAQAKAPGGGALLSKMISHPGSYAQVCDVMSTTPDVPYRAFVVTDFAGAGFSQAHLAAAEKNRGALVQAIRSRLLAVNFAKPAKRAG